MKSWPADHVERLPVSKLVPNARNARTHSDEQVAQLAASIKEWGWTIPILVDEAGGIIAGHGRVMAASRLGAPPADLLPLAKGLWQEVANQIPHGVATKSDRVTFEILIRMLAQVRNSGRAHSSLGQSNSCVRRRFRHESGRSGEACRAAAGRPGPGRKIF